MSNNLTAIDILLEPDGAMLARAKSINDFMLTSIPSPPGFALDENHRPHITVLQRYVRTGDLGRVFEEVQLLLEKVDLSALRLTAVSLAHMDVNDSPDAGLAAIIATPGPEILDFQANLIESIRPFTENGGTAQAYVRTETEPDINEQTVDYVDRYVPEHSGANFLAHITVGMARLSDLTTIEAEPFDPLSFSPSAISIYHLGNNGTAAKHLKTWTA